MVTLFCTNHFESTRIYTKTSGILIYKAKFFDKFNAKINDRQRKVLLRMFQEGPRGFEGGLSAKNYIAISHTSRATATRDLKELLAMGALTKKGELRYSRYFLL